PGQGLMEVMTDKATMEVPAPFAGTVTALLAQPGQSVKVGQHVLAYTPLGHPAEEPAEAARPAEAPVPANVTPETAPARTRGDARGHPAPPRRGLAPAAPWGRPRAGSPATARPRARGPGPGGRILREALAPSIRQQPAGPGAPPPRPEPQLDLGVAGTRKPLA